MRPTFSTRTTRSKVGPPHIDGPMASRQVKIVANRDNRDNRDNRGIRLLSTTFGGPTAAGERGLALVGALVAALGAPASARAASPPGAALLSQRLEWDGAATAVTVLSDGTVTIQGIQSGAGAPAPLTLHLLSSPGPATLRSARAELAPGGDSRYLMIRAQAGEAQRLAVVGKVGERLTAIYSGPVGPVGRDGEYSLNIEATPQGLLRYQRAPGVSRCDGEDRLFIERYQGVAGWRAAPELGLPELGSLPALTATTRAPAAAPGSPIGVYRFVSASAQVGVQRADLLAPPHELEDGKPATAWRVAAEARGAAATARADGTGHQVQALRITPAPASQGALPRQLALIFGREAQQRLLVNLSPATRDGLPQWVQLPTPVTSSCLSLVITQPDPGGQPMALGKVAIFSELDADQSDAGLRQLAERAASADFASAEAALRTLRAYIDRERTRATPGRAAALLQAIAAVLPSAQGAGRRRLHEALRALAGGPAWPELGQTLVGALLRAEPEERPTLWAAVEQLGAGAEPVLLQLAREPRLGTPGRSEVFKRLGGLATPTALQALLELAATDPPPDRALQRGLLEGLGAILHCRAAGDPLLDAALRALDQPGALAQLTSTAVLVEALGQALTGCEEATRTRLSGALLTLWQRLGGAAPAAPNEQALFTLRYRILQSLERLAVATGEVAALLQRVLAEETEPILRQAAARAAVTSAATAELSRPVGLALADADPGVRLAVLAALQERHLAQVLPAIEQVLRSDRWPGVRRAALESRAAQCPLAHESVPPRLAVLRQAVGDADEQVQRLALAGLGRCEGAGALDVYAERLKDADAAPALRSQACALLVRHGFSAAKAEQQQQAHTTVAAALGELLSDPAADERSAGTVISCTRALGELGDARDLQVLMQTATASASEVPPPIRQSALESIAKICGRGPALPAPLRQDLLRTFQAAAKDPEARVQAAAQRAQARCR